MIILEGNQIIEVRNSLSLNDEYDLSVGGAIRIALADATINYVEEFSIHLNRNGQYYKHGWVENPDTDCPLEDYMGRALVAITSGNEFFMVLLNKTFNEALDFFKQYFQPDEHTFDLLRPDMDDSTEMR